MCLKKTCSYMFECPFLSENEYQLSELTGGVSSICSLSKGDCEKDSCLLQKNGSVTITRIESDQRKEVEK